MEQTTNGNAPFLLIQKPQELIALFEKLIDQKLEKMENNRPQRQPLATPDDSPFLSAKDVQKIFHVSRQTINDWRKSELLQSFKIKSRRFFFKEQVEQLRDQMTAPKSAEFRSSDEAENPIP